MSFYVWVYFGVCARVPSVCVCVCVCVGGKSAYLIDGELGKKHELDLLLREAAVSIQIHHLTGRKRGGGRAKEGRRCAGQIVCIRKTPVAMALLPVCVCARARACAPASNSSVGHW